MGLLIICFQDVNKLTFWTIIHSPVYLAYFPKVGLCDFHPVCVYISNNIPETGICLRPQAKCILIWAPSI
jgi:hypothetical protein